MKAAFYKLLEREVVPEVYRQDAEGMPLGWIRRVTRSLHTIGPRFCAARILDQYLTEIYTPA